MKIKARQRVVGTYEMRGTIDNVMLPFIFYAHLSIICEFLFVMYTIHLEIMEVLKFYLLYFSHWTNKCTNISLPWWNILYITNNDEEIILTIAKSSSTWPFILKKYKTQFNNERTYVAYPAQFCASIAMYVRMYMKYQTSKKIK